MLFPMKSEEKPKIYLHARNGFVKANNKLLYFFNLEEKERCE